MRRCIKCGELRSLGMFDDNWRHKVNICKGCIRKNWQKYKDTANGRRKTKKEDLKGQIELLKEKNKGLLDEIERLKKEKL